MAGEVVLQGRSRKGEGKQSAKRLRNQGLLPGVVYGLNAAPMACSVDRKALEDLLHEHGRNAIISLSLEGQGEAQNTIIKELQHHPVRGSLLHVDFHRISLTEKIVVEVSVEADGVPAGVRQSGGILEHMLYRVEVECLPTQIPGQIVVDVRHLDIGDSIHVSDLKLEGDARIVTDPERTVFSVAPPTVIREPEEGVEEEEEEEAQEPELIERGKRDDEEEEN